MSSKHPAIFTIVPVVMVTVIVSIVKKPRQILSIFLQMAAAGTISLLVFFLMNPAYWEQPVAAAKEMTSVKSIPEFVEKQADLAKTSFDALVKQSARFNEMYLAAAKDVYAPLTNRASAAADMAKSLRA